MQRKPSASAKRPATKRPMLPPKRVPRAALKPMPRQMPKQQHRGGR
jgi:hypothetical protein